MQGMQGKSIIPFFSTALLGIVFIIFIVGRRQIEYDNLASRKAVSEEYSVSLFSVIGFVVLRLSSIEAPRSESFLFVSLAVLFVGTTISLRGKG